MRLPLPKAVLFDLDGTLADTAPDLATAINQLRIARSLPAVSVADLRPVASQGARGLIRVAFGLEPEQPEYETLHQGFLENYAIVLAEKSTLFEGIPSLLKELRRCGLTWGIVTNKAARFSEKVVPEIGLQDTDCLVSGDSTPFPKPHPAPLLEAAQRLNLLPRECWYVGDDFRDIQAGRAAGMITIVAGWGYCGSTEPLGWEADAVIETPLHLSELVQKTLATFKKAGA